MAKLQMAPPEGWSLGESPEYTPYGWRENMTLKHVECGYATIRAVASIKDVEGVAREFHYEIENHRCKPVLFIVMGRGGTETIWSTPEAAIEAKEKHPHVGSYIMVRPLDSERPTPASQAALERLREMERQRHNDRAQSTLEERRDG